jgi:hypothetical protein
MRDSRSNPGSTHATAFIRSKAVIYIVRIIAHENNIAFHSVNGMYLSSTSFSSLKTVSAKDGSPFANLSTFRSISLMVEDDFKRESSCGSFFGGIRRFIIEA